MADYIYLLENRLSKAQQAALGIVRDIARAKGLTVFLVGGAVRDLTSGSPVRDLDVVVQGNASKLKKDIEKSGGVIAGESEAGQALFVRFAGGVRVEVGSTLSVTYPKPGKPVAKAATILDDLRRRDFTANAMALSLNDGSYGLLMDPLNGVADIENRELRLVSNYGFIEDPVRMIRAARFMARLGWQMEEKTRSRYETGIEEGYISVLDEFHRGYETEEIFHEEDPLRVLARLESEGWIKYLAPALSVAKANVAELEKLRDVQTQLQMRGIYADAAAAAFPLLTAKLAAKEVAALKQGFVRQGFVAEIDGLEHEGKEFAAQLSAKSAAAPSQAWKLIMAAKPEAVLWVADTTKSAALQAKFKSFFTEWPLAQQKIPYALMQEMRIVPELPEYQELVEKLFFELMDGHLGTVEELKAFLEPYSPPAPPPPVHLRRPRAPKKAAKSRKKVAVEDGDGDEDAIAEVIDEAIEEALEDAIEPDDADEPEDDGDEDEDDERPVKVTAKAPAAKPVAVKAVVEKTAPVKAAAPAKTAGVKQSVPPAKAVSKTATKPAPIKTVAKAIVPAKKVAVPAKKTLAKGRPAAKAVAKPVAKGAKPAAKKAVGKVAAKGPVKKVQAKAVAKKPVAKVVAKKAPSKAPVKAATKKPIKAAPPKAVAKGKPALKKVAAKKKR